MGWLSGGIDRDLLAIFPYSDPKVEAMQQQNLEFKNGGRLMVLLSSEQEDPQLDQAATGLADHLRASDLTEQILFRPIWQEDHEAITELIAYLWLNANPEELDALASKLEPTQLGSTIEDSVLEIENTFDPVATSQLARDPLGFLNLPVLNDPDKTNTFESEDGSTRLLILYPKAHTLSAAEWSQAIEQEINQWTDRPKGLEINYTGGPAFAREIRGSIKKDIFITILISAVFSTLLFWIAVRDLRIIRIQALMISAILILTFGLGLFCFGKMSLMCVGFASILIGLVVDYGMILCNHGRRTNHGPSLKTSKVVLPIIFSSVSTAVVFASLCLSSLPGVRELGFLVATGILIGAYILLTYFLPIARRNQRKSPQLETSKPVARLKPMVKMLICLTVMVAFIPLLTSQLPPIAFDLKLMSTPNSKAAKTLTTLQHHFPQRSQDSLSTCLITAGSPEALQQKFAQLPHKDSHLLPLAKFCPHPCYQKQNIKRLSTILANQQTIIETLKQKAFRGEAIDFNKAMLKALQQLSEQSPFAYPQNNHIKEWLSTFHHLQADGSSAALVHSSDEVNEQSTSWNAIEKSISKRLPSDLRAVLVCVTLATLVMLFVSLKTFRLVLTASLCLIIPIAILSYLIRYTPLQWNFLNIFTIPLLLGLGIDYIIHISHAIRNDNCSASLNLNELQKTLSFCGTTSVIGFAALTASSNQALISFGILGATGITFTILCSLFLFPSLIRN